MLGALASSTTTLGPTGSEVAVAMHQHRDHHVEINNLTAAIPMQTMRNTRSPISKLIPVLSFLAGMALRCFTHPVPAFVVDHAAD